MTTAIIDRLSQAHASERVQSMHGQSGIIICRTAILAIRVFIRAPLKPRQCKPRLVIACIQEGLLDIVVGTGCVSIILSLKKNHYLLQFFH
jgi:hypothetical protein